MIAFVQYTEMSTGIWPMDIYSFLKCCSISCRNVQSAGCATIFTQTGAVQSDNFCFDVFHYYCTRSASAEMSTEEAVPKSRSQVLCKDSISLC